MNNVRKFLLVAAAVVAAGGVGACRDGGAGLAGTGTGEVVAGARVRGRLTRTIQVLGPEGAVRAESTTTAPFDAAVRDGTPELAGPLVAVASASALRTAPYAFEDSAGHTHTIAFERGAAGEPPRVIRATIDGQAFANVELTWRHAGRGFVLARRTSAFFGGDGRTVAREDETAAVDQVVGPGVASRVSGGLRNLACRALLPARLEAATVAAECFSQILYYAGASLAVSIGVFAIAAEPWNLKLWAGEITAIGLWDTALDNMLNCLMT